ncbi:MAG TPA: sugar ABC transporter permease [Burkholderiaceae bacterium]|nr:sugar ABC transporter permease [Burkholderiaceae bacterium]
MSAVPAHRVTAFEWISRHTPKIVLAPSIAASFVYVFVFCVWTVWVSLSNSTLLPDFTYEGVKHYISLWQNRRWTIAYTNLFLFGGFYVVGSLLIGLLLAILIDQRVRGEAIWRSVLLYPLALSFVVSGTVWRWIFNPTTGVEALMHSIGFADFYFNWILDREKAIYTVVVTGVWHASGFAMVLLLAGLRSVDQDLVKAAQIDGASMARIYWKILIPSIRPIMIAVVVILLQFAIKTFDLVVAQTGGGPGLATNVPAIYVYDLMFQRGQIAQGAAAAVMILLALAVVLVPYAIWSDRRNRRRSENGS